jgi:hypothetical protein
VARIGAIQIQGEIRGLPTKRLRGAAELLDHFVQRRLADRISFHEVDSQRDRWSRPRYPARDHDCTVVGNAVVDHDRFVFNQAKQSRPWVSSGRVGGDGADFQESEPERGEQIHGTAVLVEPGGKPHRVLEMQIADLHGQPRIFKAVSPPQPPQGDSQSRRSFSERDRALVDPFRIAAKKQRPDAATV